MGQNVHIPVTSSYDGAPLKEAASDASKLGQATGDAAKDGKEFAGQMGEMSKAAKGATSVSHAMAELFQGNLLGAIRDVTKGVKFLWLAMLENPITALVAIIGLLLPLIIKLTDAFGGGAAAAERQADSLKRVETDSQAAAKALEELNKAKLEEATNAAKELADEWDRAVKAAHELQAAKDKLTDSKMAQELAGLEAEKQAALARVRGDKDATRQTELDFQKREAEVRNRYETQRAGEELRRAVGNRSVLSEEARKRNEGVGALDSEAARAAADLAARQKKMDAEGVMTGGRLGQGKWEQKIKETEEAAKNAIKNIEEAKKLEQHWSLVAYGGLPESKGGGTAVMQSPADKAAYRKTWEDELQDKERRLKSLREFPGAQKAAADAAKAAAEERRKNVIAQNELRVKQDANDSAIEAAQNRVRAASSSQTGGAAAAGNRQDALNRQITGEHEQERLRREAEQRRSAERAARELEADQRRADAERRRAAGLGLREYEAGQPAGMPTGVSQAFHRRAAAASAAISGGNQELISAFEAYHNANQTGRQALLAKIRELTARLEANVTQSGH